MKNAVVVSLVFVLLCVSAASAASFSATAKYKRVHALGPAGYWPADEGEGAVLSDRSGNGNDAQIYNVSWEDGLLDFQVNAVQWVEIENRPDYLSGDFSIGGFVFSRERSTSGTRNWGRAVFFSNNYIWSQIHRRGQWAGQKDGLTLFLDVETGMSLTKPLRADNSLAVDFGANYGESMDVEPRLRPIDSAFITLPALTGRFSFAPYKNSEIYAGLQSAGPPVVCCYNGIDDCLQVSADQGLVFTPHVIKENFLNGNSRIDHLRFEDADGSAAFALKKFTSGQTARLLVKNGDRWYVSVSELTDAGALRLNGVTETWHFYDPSHSQVLDVGNLGPGVAGSTFTDIQAFGILLQAANSDAAVFEVESFAANLVSSEVGDDQDPGSKPQAFGVFSGGETVAAATLSNWTWQHVLYTYEKEAKVGRLYVDGKLVYQKENVSYINNSKPILIGNDMSFWLQFCGGLDGSVSDLVVFNRTLSGSEIKELYKATRPRISPQPETELIIQPVAGSFEEKWFFLYEEGRRVPVGDFMSVSPEIRCQALEEIENGTEDLGKIEFPWLVEMLREWQTRRVAAALLVKLKTEQAQQEIQKAVPVLVGILQNRALSQQKRASAVLALAELNAQATVPQMVAVLNGIIREEEARIPRVEDLLRNSLIRALLDLAGTDAEAQNVLGAALAKPILDSTDLTQDYLGGVNVLVQSGAYMDALNLFKTVSKEKFFSRGEAEYGDELQAYTREWTEGDCRYEMTCETIDRAEVDRLGLSNWSHADSSGLRRVYIAKTDASGTTEKIPFLGDWFILDTAGSSNYKLKGWTVTVDGDGYIHVMGGQHNFLNTTLYAPGVWERIGASTDQASPKYPGIGYWVSTEPGNIHSFEFVGHRDNPRNLSIPYNCGYNYMRFDKNPDGELYAFGRSYSFDVFGIGLHKYDSKIRRWHSISGRTTEMIDAAIKENPEWVDYLVQPGGEPVRWLKDLPALLKDSADDHALLVWSWHPAHYNYCRDWHAVRFDQTGRLHVRQTIRGVDENGFTRAGRVYAWSDDDGESFHRADGSPVKLPLTVNPASEYNAEMNLYMSHQWLDLWISLLQEAGY